MSWAWRSISGVVGGVTLVLTAGVYLVALLDALVGRLVAGERPRPGRVLLAPLRVAALLMLQTRTTTERPDAAAWALAPALLCALAAAAVVAVPIPGVAFPEISMGIVYFGAAMAMVMVAVYLHGWSANSFFPLAGAYRFVAEALSYEMPMVIVLIAAALPAESLAVSDIVRSQQGAWNVVRQPLGLPIYLVAGLGLAFWGPLAIPDAPDLAGGTAAESAGPPLLLWRVARAAVLVAVAVMGAAVFLGGWRTALPSGALSMALKSALLIAIMVSAGHLLARQRLERFVSVAWVVLIPLSLVDVFVSGVLALRKGR